MKCKFRWIGLLILCVSAMAGCVISSNSYTTTVSPSIRVPAEWEPHAATWMQWPTRWEASLRPAFADIIAVVQAYEPVHLLTGSEPERVVAEQFLLDQDIPQENITWHIVPVDNAWLRDNGPIYATDDAELWVQNWRFDAWGGNFGGDIPYANDDAVPTYIGQYLNLRVEDYPDYVLEKGNLEFNGTDTLVINWDCQEDRNPGLSQADQEAILKIAFGVTHIIWAYGHDPADGTTGHIDGTARFVNASTLVVADYYDSSTEQDLAVAAAAAGLNVVRYAGDPNWLVGNGFVAAMSAKDKAKDSSLKNQLETLFPNREIYMLDASALAAEGGGIHCVTNDQPA